LTVGNARYTMQSGAEVDDSEAEALTDSALRDFHAEARGRNQSVNPESTQR
jgi:hypothetical protein